MARIHVKSVCRVSLSVVCGLFMLSVVSCLLQLLDDDHRRCTIPNLDVKYRSDVYSELRHIPRTIHQIYFNITKAELPERFLDAKASWKRCHPDFNYILWNETMVEHLIDKHFADMKTLYLSYGHWIRRVDVARMFILYRYGGIYIDMDIKCRDGIHGLISSIPPYAGIGLYSTKPIGVASDFLFAKPHHPFMRHLLCSLKKAKINYLFPFLTTMLSTGPLFISICLHGYKKKDDIHLFSDETISRFVRHVEGETWHQWDGKLLWWIFNHVYELGLAMLCVAVCLFVIRYMYIRKWCNC